MLPIYRWTYHLKTHPPPIGNGWHLVDGLCLPVRSTLPALPASISLATHQTDHESDSEDDSDENEYGRSDSSDCDVWGKGQDFISVLLLK